MEHRGKTKTRARTEKRGDQRKRKRERGKRTKKALESMGEKDGGERRRGEGELCDSEQQRKAVKVAKQAAERGPKGIGCSAEQQ